MKYHYISENYLPPKVNLPNLLMYITALHYWDAPGWLWGAFGVIAFVVYTGTIIILSKAKTYHPLDLPRD